MSAILSTVIDLWLLSPLLHAAAVLPFYFSAMKRQSHSWSLAIVARWATTLFASLIIVGIFAPTRVTHSLPIGDGVRAQVQAWLAGAGPPVADFNYILWGMVAFLAGTAISGGLVGFIIGSVALGGAASGALYLFEHGNNVMTIALTAVPLWQWCLFAAGALLVVPTAMPFFERVFGSERVTEERLVLRVFLVTGAGLFVVSLLLRLLLAGAWQALLGRLTTP
jgi:hypothetical protein